MDRSLCLCLRRTGCINFQYLKVLLKEFESTVESIGMFWGNTFPIVFPFALLPCICYYASCYNNIANATRSSYSIAQKTVQKNFPEKNIRMYEASKAWWK